MMESELIQRYSLTQSINETDSNSVERKENMLQDSNSTVTDVMEIDTHTNTQIEAESIQPDTERPEMMVISEQEEGNSVMERDTSTDVRGKLGMIVPNTELGELKHNQYQCLQGPNIDEHSCQSNTQVRAVPWAQGVTPIVNVGEEAVCNPTNSNPSKTVSELRQEVLSYLAFLQHEEEMRTLINKQGSKLERENNGSETDICATIDSTNQRSPRKTNSSNSNNSENIEYLQQCLSKIKGDTNQEFSEKEIKEMIHKAICTEEEKKKLEELVIKYKEQFYPSFTGNFKAGNSFFIPHEIKLTTDNPIWTPQFRMSQVEKEIMEKETQKQFQMNVVEKCYDSPYNSPCMCVPKKEGTWRPVIDYRNVNKFTAKGELPYDKGRRCV